MSPGPVLAILVRSKTHSLPCVNVRVRDLSTRASAAASTCCANANIKHLNINTLNPNLIKLQYGVRGPLIVRTIELKKELEKGVKKPFKRTIAANLGDAHAMGQKPITFFRQVLSCVVNPVLIECAGYPDDVQARAKQLLKSFGGSAGTYTQSMGVDLIRRHVTEYIKRRDGQPAKLENVCLTQGASTGIKNVLQMFCKDIDGKQSGVMIPIPQYPLYSASLAEYGLVPVGYYLDEDKNWGIGTDELERAYQEGSKSHAVRVIVIINPGNPTGQVLPEENMKEILKFAHKHGLFVLADEVYQDNVYHASSKFSSFKKVMMEMGSPYSNMELASFMSISKGYMGECGLRGGWMEIVNLDPEVHAHLYKAISAMLCPNTIGQCVIDMIARPPQDGEPSHAQFIAEKKAVLDSLKTRSKMIVETFNKIKGFKCNVVQGAMYAFPRIELPPKAIAAAKAENKAPDLFYAFKLLEDTGICIVPGSGFGQRQGTYHFRTTILPPKEMLQEMLDIFKTFHEKFTKEYS